MKKLPAVLNRIGRIERHSACYPVLIGISTSLVAIFVVLSRKERFGMPHAAGIALVILAVSCLAWAEWRS